MLGKRRWLSIALVATLATIGFGMSAGADGASEGEFLAKINAERSAQGLGSLSVDGGLVSHARKHTQDMMDAGSIFHSSSGELQAAGGSGWSKLGENVGRGGTVASLHSAFMASAGHKKNILGDYNKVGIGTGTKDGVLYVTVVFMKKGGSSPPPTTQPPTTTPTTSPASTNTTKAPSAPKTTTTTTLPPTTTTTTLIVGPDKPVTPGESCLDATRFFWTCHD